MENEVMLMGLLSMFEKGKMCKIQKLQRSKNRHLLYTLLTYQQKFRKIPTRYIINWKLFGERRILNEIIDRDC